ncbi:MAG: hypothetical protein WDN10_01145 [bacterium]
MRTTSTRKLGALLLSATVLAGCASTGVPATSTAPSSENVVCAKDPLGLALCGNSREWITMDSTNECATFGDCTKAEVEKAKAHCEVARDAYGISIWVPSVSGGVGGGLSVAAGSAAGSLGVAFPLKVISDNTIFGGSSGAVQYAYNGAQMGVLDSLQFEEKCAGIKGAASGFGVIDVRFAKRSGVTHLNYDGTVKSLTAASAIATQAPFLDTSVLTPEGKAIVERCRGQWRNDDPYAMNKLSACIAASGLKVVGNQEPPAPALQKPPQTSGKKNAWE